MYRMVYRESDFAVHAESVVVVQFCVQIDTRHSRQTVDNNTVHNTRVQRTAPLSSIHHIHLLVLLLLLLVGLLRAEEAEDVVNARRRHRPFWAPILWRRLCLRDDSGRT